MYAFCGTLAAKVNFMKSYHRLRILLMHNMKRPPWVTARNTYSEGAAYFGGTSPLTATNVATPGGLPAFPYFAAAKYTARPAH